MAQPFQFDKAVLQVVADDKQMINTLKKDEARVNQSVNKMQGDLNKLTVGTATMGAAVGVLGASVAAMGAAAGASGNATLQAIAPIGGFVAAVGTMTVAVSLAKAELIALTVAAKAFMVTPLGAALTALAAVGAVLAVVWGRDRAAAADFRQQLDALNATIEAGVTATAKFADATDRLEDKLAVARGEMTKTEAAVRALRASLGEAIAAGVGIEEVERRLQKEKELAGVLAASAAAAKLTAETDKDAAAAQAREDKLNALRDELAILTTSLTKYDLIADEVERGLRVQIDQTREMQQQAKLTEDRARAERERFAGQGPATAAEAQRLVMDTLGLVEANQRSAALTTAAFNRLAAQAVRFGLGQEQLAKLAQTLGVEKPTTRFGAGALAITGFAATGTKGIAGLSSMEQQRDERERKRTTDTEKIRVASERTADAIANITLGAG